MNNDILFSEQQKFRQWWLWIILLGIDGSLLFRLYNTLYDHTQLNGTPHSGVFVSPAIMVTLTILFLTMRLKTQIREDGVYVQFFPFHLKFKHFTWDTLSKSFVRKYHPLSEYGGWGLRQGFGSGKAYNVSGNKGLQLLFSNGEKLLIGTRVPEQLTEILDNLGQLKG
jgi:hypothetical protein